MTEDKEERQESNEASLIEANNQIDESEVIISIKKLALNSVAMGLPMFFSFGSSVAAEIVAQHFLSDLSSTHLGAGAIINTSKLFQVGLSAPMFALYPLIGSKIGEYNRLIRNEDVTRQLHDTVSGEEDVELMSGEVEEIREDITRYLQISGWYSAAIMILLGLFFYFSEDIFDLFNQPDDVSSIAQQFLAAYIFGLPAFLYNTIMQPLLNTTGDAPKVLLANMISFPLGVVGATYAFSHGRQPQVVDIARGLAMRNWINTFFYTGLYFLGTGKKYTKSLLRPRWKNNARRVKEFVKFGLPMFMRQGGEIAAIYVTSLFYGLKGVKPMAAFNIVSQYITLINLLPMSMSGASSALVGKYEGKGLPRNAFRQGNVIIALCSTAALVSFFIVVGFGKQMPGLFIDINDKNKDLIDLTYKLFLWTMGAQVIDSFRLGAGGALLGKKDPIFPMVCGVIGLCGVGLSLSYILSQETQLGTQGVAVGYGIGATVATVPTLFRWIKKGLPTGIEERRIEEIREDQEVRVEEAEQNTEERGAIVCGFD